MTGRARTRFDWVMPTIIGGFAVVVLVVTLMFVAPDTPGVRYIPTLRSFNAPGDAMHPTLWKGEHFTVNTNYYRTHEPQYGDIAVFRLRDDDTAYVKRVVGKPGDHIQMIDGVLQINGQPVKHKFTGIDRKYRDGALGEAAKLYKETLPNGASYIVLDFIPNSPSDNTKVIDVPSGYYFVMGDNLDNSADSRLGPLYGFGFLSREKFIGLALYIHLTSDRSRFGMPLH